MRESERGGWTTTGKLRAALAFVLGIVLILLKHEVPPWAEDVFHEVGFALLVAVIIWVTFDYFSHYDEEERWRSRIEQITGEVFYGVLRRKLPKELVAEANILVLDQI